jgi:hypothetical protein
MVYKEHPEWSGEYPAIDGIAKPDRDFREADLGGTYYTPAELSIRSDIEKIFQMEDEDFDGWYKERHSTSKSLLEQIKLAGDVPYLGQSSEDGKGSTIGTSHHSLRSIVESLEKSLDYLDKIKTAREEYRAGD